MTRFSRLAIATSLALTLASGLAAQDEAQRGSSLGVELREVVRVALQEEARYGGEDGPLVSELLVLVAEGIGGLPPVTFGGAPDATYYVGATPARILSFSDASAVFVVPFPEDPAQTVFWRLTVGELLERTDQDDIERPKQVPPNAVVGPDLAARLATEARRGARPAIALGEFLEAARVVEIEAGELAALGRRLEEER